MSRPSSAPSHATRAREAAASAAAVAGSGLEEDGAIEQARPASAPHRPAPAFVGGVARLGASMSVAVLPSHAAGIGAHRAGGGRSAAMMGKSASASVLPRGGSAGSNGRPGGRGGGGTGIGRVGAAGGVVALLAPDELVPGPPEGSRGQPTHVSSSSSSSSSSTREEPPSNGFVGASGASRPAPPSGVKQLPYRSTTASGPGRTLRLDAFGYTAPPLVGARR